jgi:hypothetical protein
MAESAGLFAVHDSPQGQQRETNVCLIAVTVSGPLLDRMGTQALAILLTIIVFLGGGRYGVTQAFTIGKVLCFHPRSKCRANP